MNPNLDEPIAHGAISASAGSGKTFQLAHRFIKLLAVGVDSSRIAAFTFSRKAASEIFDSVVKYLCAAACGDAQAAQTAKQLGMPHLGRADFLRLLRGVSAGLHRLHIGTLDSFTVGVVQAFPLELGLAVRPTVIDPAGGGALRQEVLSNLLAQQETDHVASRAFMQAFKQATFGQEPKDLDRVLDEFLDRYLAAYRTLPHEEAWAHEETIWSGPCPWIAGGDIRSTADTMTDSVTRSAWSESTKQRWRQYLEAVRDFGPRSPWSNPLGYLFKKLSANIESLRAGSSQITLGRTRCTLDEQQSRLALATFNHVMATQIDSALQQTRGLFNLLSQFERVYDESVRCRGQITFEDCQRLLGGAGSVSDRRRLGPAMDPSKRLDIDYRLDARLDHWLLDEFQDTSDLQWEVLANLADEILQDTSGRRSFFFVGDVKQAVYGWRGGNARLFGHVLARYGTVIQQTRLATSYRSCPELIQTVNEVFGGLDCDALPPRAVSQWRAVWDPHTCAQGMVPARGHTALYEVQRSDNNPKPGAEDRYAAVAQLIHDIKPLERNLSVGVLVRTNDQGRAVVGHLRRACRGLHITHEGRATIRDNPVVELLLSLVAFAFHPGDSRAWRHLQFSPLWGYLERRNLDRDRLGQQLLRQAYEEGFLGLLRAWGTTLDTEHPLDPFGRLRLDGLLEAAGAYDQTGPPDGCAFLRFVDAYQVKPLENPAAVRVMTVHQAKGLEFDAVFLPELQNGSMVKTDPGGLLTAHDTKTGLPQWVTRMPRREIVEADPALARHLATSQADACFEQLCVLYVAMTRAKQALYMVTSDPGRNSTSFTPGAFVKTRLLDPSAEVTDAARLDLGAAHATRLYQQGRADWVLAAELPAAASPPAATTALQARVSRHPWRKAVVTGVSPSAPSHHTGLAAGLFDPSALEGRALGSAVHALFECVEWIEDTDLDRAVKLWSGRNAPPATLKRRAEAVFRRAVSHDAVRSLLSRPGSDAQLWCERGFDVILHNTWVRGTFDRVVIRRDPAGRPVSASIVDFKTDRIGQDNDLVTAVEHHRGQLEVYRAALGRILSLDTSRITLAIVFTDIGRVCDPDRFADGPIRPAPPPGP